MAGPFISVIFMTNFSLLLYSWFKWNFPWFYISPAIFWMYLVADSIFSALKTTPVRGATFKFWVVSPNNIHVPALFSFSLWNLKGNINKVHWDGERISKIKHLLIQSVWKHRAVSFYDETTIWCWEELQSWTAVSGKPELCFAWCWYLPSTENSFLCRMAKVHSLYRHPEQD